jgi:hypothetical protein
LAQERNVRWCVAVLALTLAAGSAWATGGTISGQVTDASGLPLEGVAVSAQGFAAVTDAGGLYALAGLSASPRVVVTFEKAGYATTYGAVELADGLDDDGDGIPDTSDRCPNSQLNPIVTIDGCETGMGNKVVDGCSGQDIFNQCAARSTNVSGLVPCIKTHQFFLRTTNNTWENWKKAFNCMNHATWPLAELIVPPVVQAAEATLSKVMVPVGRTQTIDPEIGGVLAEGGFVVSFPPGALAATGPVEVTISPIQVFAPELGAFPGDYQGLDAGGAGVLLETFGLMDVLIRQNGEPVQLKPGMAARLEFPLPEGSNLAGDVPLWFFDPATGLWKEEAIGTVGPSSVLPGFTAVIGSVAHFSWWNADKPYETTCMRGVVVDHLGNPVAGAAVIASGQDYSGSSYATTDGAGQFCIDVRISSLVRLSATKTLDGVVFTSNIVVRGTPPSMARCSTGGCESGLRLALAAPACISGVVQDAAGQGVEGARVVTYAGASTVSGPGGAFCLPATAGVETTVYATGYVPVPVTPLVPATCPSADCATVTLTPLPAGANACISGELNVDFAMSPPISLVGLTVEVLDWRTGDFLGSGVTGADRRYCVSDLPAFTAVRVRVKVDTFWCEYAETYVASGPPGVSCAGGGCVDVSMLYCPQPS